MSMSPDTTIELSGEDRRLLDVLAEAAFDPAAAEGLPEADRTRARRLLDLLHLLQDYPTEDGDDTLVHATLARIDRVEEQRAARMAFDDRAAEPEIRRSRIRMPDFVSIAAIILIAVGVLWPIASYVRDRSVDFRCQSNLRYVSSAFDSYRADHDRALPMATAGFGSAWRDQANYVNLEPLVGGGYCEHDHLDCPGSAGHDHEHASYSYQWQRPDAKVPWGTGSRVTLILGDRNPLVDAYRAGRVAAALSATLNHGGRGQNTLASDGSILWLKIPVTGSGDNIWLPRGASALRAGLIADEDGDVFLVH